MLSQLRHQEILHTLNAVGSVRVGELASRMDVATETIRRDLEALESQGELRRTHGGAVSVKDKDEPFFVRRTQNAKAKASIAKRALAQIEGHEVIAMDASTTTLALAHLLPDLPRTVVTNSLPIAAALATKQNITTVVSGGTIDHETLGLHGTAVDETFRKFACSIAFISCFGFDERRGPGEPTEARAMSKQAIIGGADRVVLLADKTKFKRRPAFFVCDPSEIDEIISDS